LGEPGIEERSVLRWIISTWSVRLWSGLNWVKTGSSEGKLRTR
jgi:hypothetical protein